MRTTLGPTPHVAISVGDDAVDTDAIADDAVTYAKVQNVSADERILGRVSGADGVIEELTKAQVLTFANVEDGADITDTTNVTAAGALMDSELAGIAAVKATTGTFLSADESKLDGIEASATADQTAGQILTLLEDGIDSVHYADTSIDEDHIADNAVTLAKMAGLVRGKIIYGDASGDPAALAIGSDNYVLTVDGSDIGWEAASGGGISTALTGGNILVGNSSNIATSVNPTGDIDVTDAGLFSIKTGVIVDGDVNGSAAIALSKTALVAGTNITLATNTLNVDDAFLTNNANDTTTGTITAAGFTATGNVQVSSAPADDTVSGIVASFTADENLSRGEVVYVKSDGTMAKAVATATGTMPVVAMAAADISADAAGLFLLQGFIRDDGTFPAYGTVGGRIYAPEAETSSENVPEQTAPDTDGDFVQDLGFAVSANILYFNPSGTLVEVS